MTLYTTTLACGCVLEVDWDGVHPAYVAAQPSTCDMHKEAHQAAQDAQCRREIQLCEQKLAELRRSIISTGSDAAKRV